MKNKVLIITGKEDPMWAFLLEQCSSEEKNNLVHYVTDDPFHSQCVYNPIEENLNFFIDGFNIDKTEIKSIWWRRTPMPQFNFSPELNHYCEEEYLTFLQGFEFLLPGAVWVSKPSSIHIARNKALQLNLAKYLGLTVLDTIFTNPPHAGSDFINTGKSIYKSIKSPRIPMSNEKATTVFTSIIEQDQKLDGLISCPGIFQRFTEKRCDIRVSVFGSKVFAVKIESQQNSASKIDFRKGARDVPHLKHNLPEEVILKCRTLVERLDLKYGAIDLALMEDNSYIFFEINPNGQWGWLEEKTGMPMRRALLDLLFGT